VFLTFNETELESPIDVKRASSNAFSAKVASSGEVSLLLTEANVEVKFNPRRTFEMGLSKILYGANLEGLCGIIKV